MRTDTMKPLLLFPLLLIAALPAPGREYLLADLGRTGYRIVIPPSPSPAEELAGEELARVLRRMTNACFPLLKGTAPSPRVIRLAETASLSRLTTSPPLLELGAEGYALVPDGEGILVIGARGRALLNGTYALLDRLGCRWLAPEFDHYEGTAQLVPRTQRLTLQLDRPLISCPAFAYRKLYVEEGHSHTTESLLRIIEWMPRVGYNTLVVPTDYQGTGRVKWDNWRARLAPELRRRDLIIEVGGHGYQNFISPRMEGGTLFDRHPEWFGQDEKGQRRKAKSRVFCTSNPEAIDYLTSNVTAYLAARPEIEIFDFWPPDGADWCACAACARLGGPADRQALLVSTVRSRIARIRPDLRLEVLAYSTSLAPPESAPLPPDVLLDFCPISQNFWTQIDDARSSTNLHYARTLRAWREKFRGEISIYSYYRKYAWDSLPVLLPRYMRNDLRFYRSVPVQGISTYAEPGDWFTYEINHYALAELARAPDADVEALVEKFCRARYGPAAREAARLLTTLGDLLRRYGSIPGTRLPGAKDLARAEARLAGAVRELERAAPEGENDPSVRRSLERLRLMAEYGRRDLALRKLQASGASRDQIRNEATDLYRFLERHANKGVFLTERITLNRVLANYGISGSAGGAE